MPSAPAWKEAQLCLSLTAPAARLESDSRPLVIDPPVCRACDESEARDVGRRLAHALGGGLSERLALRFHDNRSVALSFERNAALIAVRLHRTFLQADDETIVALAEYIRTGSNAAARLLDTRLSKARPASPLRTEGYTHDLQALFDSLNASHFDNRLDATIGWGRGRTLSAHSRLGAYCDETRTITLHPALDSPSVPAFVVSFIVYHEMLHQAVPPIVGPNGRRVLHPPEFRRRERKHPDWREARRYTAQALGRRTDED